MTRVKILRLLCLAAVVSAGVGCVAERTDDCPPPGPNVNIDFGLFDGGVFTREITSVAAVLFDGRGNYIPPATTLDRTALERFAGVNLTLDPGDYRMVFWANVGENTDIRVVDGTPVLVYKDFDGTERQVMGNGDPVWYAPAVRATRVEGSTSEEGATRVDVDARPLSYYEFTVTAQGEHTGRVNFTETHNTVNIYIGGLPIDPASMPTIEITGLTPAVSFWGMAPLDDPLPTVTSAVQSVPVTRDNATFALAAFDTPPLGDMTGMWVVVRDAAGNELFRMPLADAIAQSGIASDAHELSPLLYLGEARVLIGIGDWNNIELGKEWWIE